MNRSTRHTVTRCRSHRGAVMVETVLVLPLLFLILGLIFYFGIGYNRAIRTTEMARYEVWRQAQEGDGPRSQWTIGHPQLNETFHQGKATAVSHRWNAPTYPEQPLSELTDRPATDAARTLIENIIYRPPGGAGEYQHRYSHGHREGFEVHHAPPAPMFAAVHGPMTRSHTRIGDEWRFSDDPSASADSWSGGGGHQAHLRGLRDSFLLELDQALDSIDGRRDPEYDDYPSGPQHIGGNYAAEVRRVYLRSPGYRGPIVRR